MRWPLPLVPSLPSGQGLFGAARLHDIHTGVDLYAPPGTSVLAAEDGEVAAIDPFFTGGDESPWWETTAAVMVEGASGVVLYGEVEPLVDVGQQVRAGDLVGRVKQVLRPRPGKVWKNPPSMLHLELYAPGARAAVWWKIGEERPAGLLDPGPALVAAAASPPERVLAVVGVLRREDGRVLMLRRYPDDREAAGLGFPGGKVEPGESLADALPREFLEETGIAVGFGAYLGVHLAGRFEIHAFAVEHVLGQLRPDFPTAEHVEGLWLDLPRVDRREMAGPATRAIADLAG